jgi:hypothetical protein
MWLAPAAALLFAVTAPIKPEDGFVVDFAPARWTAESAIRVRLKAADGTVFARDYHVAGPHVTATQVRDLVEVTAGAAGWAVTPDRKAGLTLTTYDNGAGSRRVVECSVTVSDVPASAQPTVRPVKK